METGAATGGGTQGIFSALSSRVTGPPVVDADRTYREWTVEPRLALPARLARAALRKAGLRCAAQANRARRERIYPGRPGR
eukprot:1193780-Prorocentrum_minimum.AAC.5